jgi:hypothetical protein
MEIDLNLENERNCIDEAASCIISLPLKTFTTGIYTKLCRLAMATMAVIGTV